MIHDSQCAVAWFAATTSASAIEASNYQAITVGVRTETVSNLDAPVSITITPVVSTAVLVESHWDATLNNNAGGYVSGYATTTTTSGLYTPVASLGTNQQWTVLYQVVIAAVAGDSSDHAVTYTLGEAQAALAGSHCYLKVVGDDADSRTKVTFETSSSAILTANIATGAAKKDDLTFGSVGSYDDVTIYVRARFEGDHTSQDDKTNPPSAHFTVYAKGDAAYTI